MPTYEQNKKSAEKYLATMDRLTIRTPKESGLKAAIQAHAESTGESVQAFIIRAITQAMEQDRRDADTPAAAWAEIEGESNNA